MAVEHQGEQVRHEVVLAAPSAAVWKAVTTPEGLRAWLARSVEGRFEPGQVVTMRWDCSPAEQAWALVDMVAGQRLVLEHTPASPPSAYPQRLEISLVGGDDATQLIVIHSGFAEGARGVEWFQGAESAWELRLATLQHYVERFAGQDRRCFEATVAASYSYDGLLGYFLESDLLAQWLVAEGGLGMPGEPFVWTLRDGRAVRGKTLAVTPREVAVELEEGGGVLQLRAMIQIPGGRVIALHGSLFDATDAACAAWQAYSEAALGRLKGALACAPLTSGVF
jgi:uncharacterized protein YndB with AHSA1/START domain